MECSCGPSPSVILSKDAHLLVPGSCSACQPKKFRAFASLGLWAFRPSLAHSPRRCRRRRRSPPSSRWRCSPLGNVAAGPDSLSLSTAAPVPVQRHRHSPLLNASAAQPLPPFAQPTVFSPTLAVRALIKSFLQGFPVVHGHGGYIRDANPR